MVKKIKTSALLVIAMFFSLSMPVLAQTDTGSSDQTLQSTETEADDDKSAGRETRLKSYKEKATTKLADAQEKRLTSRCKAAQGKVASLRAKVNNAVANRKKVYQEVGDKLDSLLEKLVAAGMDTTKLETARADIRTELATLTESLNAYDTVLADLTVMDCTADPQTFQVALISARETQVALRAQAQEFRRFVTTELRAILQEIRSQLETANSTTTDTTEPTEGEN
jgi:chromosome segregation ATPase